MFKFNEIKKPKINKPLLIEGLPGMGNVGKIAVDFIIENIEAQKIIEITSYSFPHAVFVTEDNLVELPTINIYHKKIKNRDILFIAGDIQPLEEQSSYEFCDKVLDFFEKLKGTEIITLGGIGLQNIPQKPKVYITGNKKSIINKYKNKVIKTDIHGIVGPIIGISGLLLGTAKQRNIPAISLLAETFGDPSYLGIKGAREIIKILDKKFFLDLDLEELDLEVSEIEQEIKQKSKTLKKLKKLPAAGEMNYIG